MIIIGYPGIGKSTLAENDADFIDLDSSMYDFSNNYSFKQYCKDAEAISASGKDVFVSSHQKVRCYLKKNSKEELLMIFPRLSLEKDWLKKMFDRMRDNQTAKNQRAFDRVAGFFPSDVKKMMKEDIPYIVILGMGYDLRKLIKRYKDGMLTADNEFYQNKE